ncbi:MAG: cell division protein FtsQ/DivIB [Fidelibacterota bacterium]
MSYRRLNKRQRRKLRKVLSWTGRTVAITTFFLLIYAALWWGDVSKQFKLEMIQFYGNNYLDENDLLYWLQVTIPNDLTHLDLPAIQERLKNHPYIKTARASHGYPSTLRIEIMERKPIAYLNHSPFYMVDNDGVILPLKHGKIEFDLPYLSGFNSNPELYPEGDTCLSNKVLEAVEFLTMAKIDFPSLYTDISEVLINPKDEFVVLLSQRPTKIILGTDYLTERIMVLEEFSSTLKNIRSLHDYKSIDLRYRRQIIVKEWV